MVKGISKQVIVVNSADKKLFEQAIFILSDEASQNGVTNEMLLRQAKQMLQTPLQHHGKPMLSFAVSALVGALATGLVWLMTVIL